MPADRTPWTHAEQLDYTRRMLASPANREAAALVAALTELESRLDTFAEAHGSDCRCNACCEDNEEGDFLGYQLRDVIEAAAWSVNLFADRINSFVLVPDDLELLDIALRGPAALADEPAIAAAR
jgi:hypothetical protein